MASQRLSPPVDALAAGCADARRLRRLPSFAASHHYGVLTPLLAVATAGRERATLHAASTHGRSGPPPSPASVAATA
jgi:hypothetical protein